MALIKCPECGREISDKAAACVHCGCPVTKPAQSSGIDMKQIFGANFAGAVRPDDISVSMAVRVNADPAGKTENSVYVQQLGESVRFNVPNNIKVGQRIRIPGRGLTGADGTRSDLLINIAAVEAVPAPQSAKTVPSNLNEFIAKAAEAGVTFKPADKGTVITRNAKVLEEVEKIIKAYKPSVLAKFCARIFFVFIAGIVALAANSGFDSSFFAGLIVFGLMGAAALITALRYPFHHRKKYYNKNRIDEYVRNDSGNMSVAIKVYNSMPGKQMLAYIKGLNPAAGQKIEKQLAEMPKK